MTPELNKVKMVFLDIDGTLYNTKKQVTEYTKNILNKAKDEKKYIVLCSGRSNSSVCEISKDINASKYVIACNGSFVYNYENDIEIFENALKKETLENIWNICEKEDVELVLESKKITFGNAQVWKREPDKHIKINGIEDIKNKKIMQMVIDNVGMDKRQKIMELLLNDEDMALPNYGINRLGKFWFDINSKNIDKGVGIQHLINKLGIKKEETIGFGDGINDCAMFKACGTRVAMGNAKEELKNMADYITLTNDQNGVATFIEKHILSK